jgi:hemolysin activation/secretion protein
VIAWPTAPLRPSARPRTINAARRIALLATAMLSGLCALPAAAAQGTQSSLQGDPRLDTLPTVDRDRVDRTQARLPTPAGPPPALPGSSVSVSAGPSQTVLTKVRFEGVSLPGAWLARVAAPFLGKPITPDNLQALATAVGNAYAKSDIAYYAVMIPPQTPAGGVLTLRVTEGRITQYTLNGTAGGKATPRIAEQIARLMHAKPLRKSGLDRALTTMRALPGQTVTAQMRQIGTTGDLILDLTTHRKVADVKVTIDNSGVANVIQAFQAQVEVGINNVLRDGDRLRVSSYLPLHPDRYQFYSAGYTVPLTAGGLSLGLNAAQIYTRTNDQSSTGKATLGGLTLTLPVLRSSKTNLSLTTSLDGLNSSNYYLDTAFGDYRTRVLRLGAGFSRADDKNGYALGLVVSHGLDALGARAFTGFSQNDFTKVNAQAVVVRSLNRKLTLKVTAHGQYSSSLLPVTERAIIGGPEAGRAFQIGTLTGEKAATGMAELSWTLPVKARALAGTSVFTFVDGAVGGTVARPYYGLAADSFSLASAGGGLRLRLLGKWTASAELAVPIKRPSDAYSRRARVFVSLGSTF